MTKPNDAITLEEFQRIKKTAERLQREADQAAGRLAQIDAEHEKQYGTADEHKLEARLKKLEREAEQAETEAAELLAQFNQEYGDRLEEV